MVQLSNTTLLELILCANDAGTVTNHTIFILVVNEQEVHFSTLLKFGNQIDQLVSPINAGINERDPREDLLHWLLESGLAWLLV